MAKTKTKTKTRKIKVGKKSHPVIKFGKQFKKIGSGLYGTYYQISKKRGIKIIEGYIDNRKNIRESGEYYEAMTECELLKIASKSGVSPRRPRVVIVTAPAWGYAVGIEMEHFEGETVEDYEDRVLEEYNSECAYDEEEEQELERELEAKMNVIGGWDEKMEKALRKVGIYHEDVHENNVIVTPFGLRVIDFSDEFISLKRKTDQKFKATLHRVFG